MSILQGGVLKDKKIFQRIFPNIEKGPLKKVNAVVIHQTGAPTAQSSFNSYMNGGYGAHFLIDNSGTVYQTAHLDKKTYHVGKIKSKCFEASICSSNQLQAVRQILFKSGKSYPDRVRDLDKHERKKGYPDRYPLNEDSIGIEIVGNYNKSKKIYDGVTGLQNQSLGWLISELFTHFSITKADIYRHPEVSYKTPSEASTATW